MKLSEPTLLYFEFELDDEGLINSVDGIDDTEETEIQTLIKGWVKKNLVPLGEKTEGQVRVEDTWFSVQGRVCTELGEDWDSDVWEDYEFTDDF